MLVSVLNDPCFLLGLLADELDQRGTRSRHLASIAFVTECGHISVCTRSQPLAETYPDLQEILDDIGRTCRDEGIAVEHLLRISFYADEVNLETNNECGGIDLYCWPILPCLPRDSLGC